jgi:hypothetical protein
MGEGRMENTAEGRMIRGENKRAWKDNFEADTGSQFPDL